MWTDLCRTIQEGTVFRSRTHLFLCHYAFGFPKRNLRASVQDFTWKMDYSYKDSNLFEKNQITVVRKHCISVRRIVVSCFQKDGYCS